MALTPDMKATARMMLVRHEGYRRFPYVDTVGKVTIGVGYNLTDRGLPDSFINAQLNQDIEFFYNELSNGFAWFDKLDEVRQLVLVDMCFMGFKTFCTFTGLLLALAQNNYDKAAEHMLNSLWAKQVGSRAIELAYAMRTGQWMIKT